MSMKNEKFFFDTEFLEGSQEGSKPTIDLISIGIVSMGGDEYEALSKDFNLELAWDDEWIKDNVLKPIFLQYVPGGITEFGQAGEAIEEESSPVVEDTEEAPPEGSAVDAGAEGAEEEKTSEEEPSGAEEETPPEGLEDKTGEDDPPQDKEAAPGATVTATDSEEAPTEEVKEEEVVAEEEVENPVYFTMETMCDIIELYGENNAEIAVGIYQFINPDWDGKITEDFDPNVPEFWADYCSYDWVVFCWLFGTMSDLPKGFPMYCNDLRALIEHKLNRGNWFYDMSNQLRSFVSKDPEERLKEIRSVHRGYPQNTSHHTALPDARWNKDMHIFMMGLRLK